jgi:effector-binding domain-containing protein
MDLEDLDMEIGFPFAQTPVGKGSILSGQIPGGRAATCLHVGPYDQLGAAYKALQDWMQANGHATAGVAYEFYLNDPQTVPPADLQTQLVFPLK